MAKQNFLPPAGVATSAARGLKWRREHGRGGTRVGVARARDLSRGIRVSLTTVKRMAAFFARHSQDAKKIGWFYGEKGFPTAGRIAWELWGGEAGERWAKNVLKQLEARNGSNRNGR